ncbi:MAG: lipolytic enzyme, G-D-S-L [Rhodobacteraceae bacterium]|nr:lipolytic enzyme, G-D-S-L [Paracoccaceae bacterium]
MPSILTFGDSNTHGMAPMTAKGDYRRFAPDVRWPGALRRLKGADLIEDGLPGRTAQFPDPVNGAHMDGRPALRMALESHGPLDLLVLMLGTNDIKTRFGATPEMVTAGIAGLIDLALTPVLQARHGGFRVLLICPPPVLEQGPIAGEFIGSHGKSLALPPLYQALAAAHGVGFLDAGRVIGPSPLDGVHYDEAAHAALGQAVATAVTALLA